MFKILTKSIAA